MASTSDDDRAGRAAPARRPRRRYRLAALAGVLVLVLAAGGYLALRDRDDPPPVAEAVPTTPVVAELSPPPDDWYGRPLELPGGYLLVGATTTDEEEDDSPPVVLDRANGRYVGFPEYDEVWAAPRGGVAAVFDAGHRRQTGLLDLATKKVRWIQVGAGWGHPAWSPEGTRLVLTATSYQGTYLGILDAASGEFHRYPIDDSYLCTDYCHFTWMPDGREVAYQQTDPDQPRSESKRHPRRGLQLFSAETGEPTRLLPVHGDVAGPYAWSPDGRRVVITGQESPQLVDAATGAVVRELPSAEVYWAGDDQLVLVGSPMARVMDLTGQTVARQPLPKELHPGYVLAVAPR